MDTRAVVARIEAGGACLFDQIIESGNSSEQRPTRGAEISTMRRACAVLALIVWQENWGVQCLRGNTSGE